MSVGAGPGPRRIAVLDIGKTNVKVLLFDAATGAETAARTMPNPVRQDGPYPHVDTGRIQAFVLDALAEFVRQDGGFDAVSIAAHGAAGALIGADGLALPVLDYEHDGPDQHSGAYDRVRPRFQESFSPRLPGGLNLGAQLFWQQRTFPARFADAVTFVTYPQYWAWWLTGVAATERTSLGAHTDLWAPAAGAFSSLVAAQGWTALMAPLRSCFDTLGPVRPEHAHAIGLVRPTPVLCGIHDSNASLLPYLQDGGEPLSIVSTGTWVILFALQGSLAGLDSARDTLANVDAFGRAVPSARFMGGREFDWLTGGAVTEPDDTTVNAVLTRGVMALPSFSPGNGPFGTQAGRWSHDPAGLSPGERTAAASLYAALTAATCLDLLAARGRTIVEGPFARNALFCESLAGLTARPVAAARRSTGTGAGAARLAAPLAAKPGTDAVPAAPFRFGDALASYARRWRQAVG